MNYRRGGGGAGSIRVGWQEKMAQGSLNVQMSVSAVERLRYKGSYIASFKGSFVFLQGLYQLLEPSLVIRTRRADVANVKVGLTE